MKNNNKTGNLYTYDEAERIFDCQIKAISYCKMRSEVVAVYLASKKVFHTDSLYFHAIVDACKKKTDEIVNGMYPNAID